MVTALGSAPAQLHGSTPQQLQKHDSSFESSFSQADWGQHRPAKRQADAAVRGGQASQVHRAGPERAFGAKILPPSGPSCVEATAKPAGNPGNNGPDSSGRAAHPSAQLSQLFDKAQREKQQADADLKSAAQRRTSAQVALQQAAMQHTQALSHPSVSVKTWSWPSACGQQEGPYSLADIVCLHERGHLRHVLFVFDTFQNRSVPLAELWQHLWQPGGLLSARDRIHHCRRDLQAAESLHQQCKQQHAWAARQLQAVQATSVAVRLSHATWTLHGAAPSSARPLTPQQIKAELQQGSMQMDQLLCATAGGAQTKAAAAVFKEWDAAVGRAIPFAQAAAGRPAVPAAAMGSQREARWCWRDDGGHQQGPYSMGDIMDWHQQGHLPAQMLLFQPGSEGQAQPLQDLLAAQAARSQTTPPQASPPSPHHLASPRTKKPLSLQPAHEQPDQGTASLAALPAHLAHQWSQARPATPDMAPPTISHANSLSPDQKAAQLLQAIGYGRLPADDHQPASAQAPEQIGVTELGIEAEAFAAPLADQAPAGDGSPADTPAQQAARSLSDLLDVSEGLGAGVSSSTADAESAQQLGTIPAESQTLPATGSDLPRHSSDLPPPDASEAQLSTTAPSTPAAASNEPAGDVTLSLPAQAAFAAQPAEQKASWTDAECQPLVSRDSVCEEQHHEQQQPYHEPSNHLHAAPPELQPTSTVCTEGQLSAAELPAVQQVSAELASQSAHGRLGHSIPSTAADTASAADAVLGCRPDLSDSELSLTGSELPLPEPPISPAHDDSATALAAAVPPIADPTPTQPAAGISPAQPAQQEATERPQSVAAPAIEADLHADVLSLLQGYGSDDSHADPEPAPSAQAAVPLARPVVRESTAQPVRHFPSPQAEQHASQLCSPAEIPSATCEARSPEQHACQDAVAGTQSSPPAVDTLTDRPGELAAAHAANANDQAAAGPPRPTAVPQTLAVAIAAADEPGAPQSPQDLGSPQQQTAEAPVSPAAPPKRKRGRPPGKSARLTLPGKAKKAKVPGTRQPQAAQGSAEPPPQQHSSPLPQVPAVDLWHDPAPVVSPPCSPSRPSAPRRGADDPPAEGGDIAETNTAAAAEQMQTCAEAGREGLGSVGGAGMATGSRHVTPASDASCSTELPEGQLAAMQASQLGTQHRSPGLGLPAKTCPEPIASDPATVLVLGRASGTAGPKRVKRAYRTPTPSATPKASPQHATSPVDTALLPEPHPDQQAASHDDRQPAAHAAVDSPQPDASQQQLDQPAPAVSAPSRPAAAELPLPQPEGPVFIPPDDQAMQYYIPISERVKRQRKPSSAHTKPPLPAPVPAGPKPRQQPKGQKAVKPPAKPKARQAAKRARSATPSDRSATPEPAPPLRPTLSAAQKRQLEAMQAATCARGRAWAPGQQGRGSAEGPGSPKRAKIRAESPAAPAASAPPEPLQGRRAARSSRAAGIPAGADDLAENPLQAKAADLRPWRSKLHGWGLVANAPIKANAYVIEYVGELVRNSVSDRREREYDASGLGSCYMFRLDHDRVVDATRKGGLARFINHSCAANCFTKIVTVNGDKHIIISAKRDIARGEELTYDYKFSSTPDEEAVPCNCGARNCRGRLN